MLVAAMLVICWWLDIREPKRGSTANSFSITNQEQTTTALSQEQKSATEQMLFSTANDLASTKSAEERKSALARLRQFLATGSTNEITAAIRKLLDSKADAPTGQGFKIGKGGVLLDAPTLRTLLLDQLARFDPAAAAEYSKVILSSMNSPDEWAVALRNLAEGDTSSDGRALLEQKTLQMLRYAPWQQNPSVGYLEAFDTAVYLGGTDLVPTLTDMVRGKDNPALEHAAFLALDRMVIDDPTAMLGALEANSSLMQGRESTEADYFARANVGDPAQRAIVESYLLDPARTPAELQAFAGIFPNANFMISQNLLTQNVTMNAATLQQRDQTSLQVVGQWLQDPRFNQIKQQLQTIQMRLEQFVSSAH